MADRPILFSAPMVRAILDGRKTQTRRIFKARWGLGELQNLAEHGIDAESYSGKPNDPKSWGWPCAEDGINDMSLADWPETSGYTTGDRLWVRETFAYVGSCDPGFLLHRASYPKCAEQYDFDEIPLESAVRWTPSIHMPRAASRLTLAVTDVRVERLQDISEADAEAEGALLAGDNTEYGDERNYYEGFRDLWDSINGSRKGAGWADNPWVVAISFDAEQRNIDQ